MDINEPVENSGLLQAIHRLKSHRTSQEELFGELKTAELLCPVQMKLQESNISGNEISAGEGSSVQVRHIRDKKGQKFLMAFTDWQELRKWSKKEDQETLVCTVNDYAALMNKSGNDYAGMVLNPFGESLVLTPQILRSMIVSEQGIHKDEDILIGKPARYPTALIDRLKVFFQQDHLVEKAYLLWMVRGSEGSYLLILDSKHEQKQLYTSIGEFCRPYLNGNYLDIISADTEFGKKAIEGQAAFYDSGNR